MTDQPTESALTLLQRAEKIASLDEVTFLQAVTPESIRQLLHELRVHQIELEMQNEELLNTQHELEVSRVRYFDLYNLAPVGYLTINAQGLILEANLAGASMLGEVRESLLKKPVSEFIYRDDQDIFYLHRKIIIEENNVQEWEMRLKRPDGLVFWAHLQATPVDNGEYGITLSDITTRKRDEELIRRGKEEWERTFDSVPDLITILDDQHRIVRVNKAMEKRLGLTPNECVGQVCFKSIHGTNEPPELCPHSRTLTDGREHVAEVYEERLGGYFLVTTTPLMDEHGNMIGTVHVARDITEGKQAEMELQRLAQQRQLALDAAHMGWWHYDPSTRIASWDDGFKEIFGVTDYESPIEEILAHIHPDDLPWVWSKVEAALDPVSPQPYLAEYRIYLPNGSMRYVDAHGITSFEGIGENRRATSFVGTVADISERKKAEEEHARLAAIVESSDDAIIGKDQNGIIIDWNEGAELLFGYRAEEIVGRPGTLLIPPEQLEEDAIVQQRLAAGQRVEHYETVRLARDGRRIEVSVSVSPIKDSNGRIIGASKIARDITKRKRMEEELRSSKAAAEAANIAKSQFLATMSHEIRNPMNGVIGMIELLQHTELTAEQYEYAESAKNSGIELVLLLNGILDLSKIEADKLILEKTAFDLQALISETVKLLSFQAREKGLEFTFTINSEVPTALIGDAGRLRQIIVNLIGNAIKFTSKGSITLQIQKDVEDEFSTTLRFLVRDSGIGITAEKLEHIFEPFTQADSSTTRVFGGTGLGLTICKRLVMLMGGNIGVDSVVGQGTTFFFTIVMEKQTKAPLSNSPLRVERLETPSANGGGPRRESLNANETRILLAEDDLTAQKIVPKLLSNYGYKVDIAKDGKEALQLLETNDYALVLTDCMMPQMSGYEVTAVIRDPASAVRRHDIPIIALTGNIMNEDFERSKDAGMDDQLPKPLLLPDLLAKLEKWLRR